MIERSSQESTADPNKAVTAPVVLIPALSLDSRLVELARKVLAGESARLIVVDDGSDAPSGTVFDELKTMPSCTVLRHDENKGKGRALKTGMEFFLANFPDSVGVVTADCDGQHTPVDIQAVADELSAHPDDLILGVRDFSGAEIPPKSRFGNNLTKRIFRLLTGLDVTDTQTGLRGIPASQMKLLHALDGERFEYELNMLLACKQHGVAVRQIRIATIYLENNSGTHFNPLTDSIRVYLVFLKFISSSLISFLVDYGSFLLWLAVFSSLMTPVAVVFWAGIVSRVVSSAVNYTINRKVVFKSDAKYSPVKYYILAAVLMVISSASVAGLSTIAGGGAPLFKILVDSLLFIASFTVQREWVFSTKKNTNL